MAAFQVPTAVRGLRIATPGFVMTAHRLNIKVEVMIPSPSVYKSGSLQITTTVDTSFFTNV
jgi:hypothetical protein